MRFFLGLACVVLAVTGLDERPIFGIVALPQHDVGIGEKSASAIPASYVKFLESAGARVAVIPFGADVSELDSLVKSVNGILFTGGGLSLLPNTSYFATAKHILDLAQREWDNGVHFPVHGTCMGMQLLSILLAEDHSVLEEYAFDSENYPLPLDFTPEAHGSRMFGNAPSEILEIFRTKNVTINLHHDGVPPEAFVPPHKDIDMG